MKIQLRKYQSDAITAILDNLGTPSWSLVEMPTGSGKTEVMKNAAAQASHLQILIITPRKKLLTQLQSTFPTGVGIMSASYGDDDGNEHDLVLATGLTIINKIMKSPEVIFIDECHLLAPNSKLWSFLISFPNAKIYGFTATPYRGDQHISTLGWRPIFNISILDLVKEKFLVPPRSMGTDSEITISGNDRQRTNLLLAPLLQKVKTHNSKKLVVFCHDIAHAQFVQDKLTELGEGNVFMVHSEMRDVEIEDQYDSFKKVSGRSWLINVTLVSIGVDIPCIDCIVILRDVSSFALFVQMLGRGLRLFPGKTECLVYDFGGATERFGFIDKPDFQHTASVLMRSGVRGMTPTKACTVCDSLNMATAKVCTFCHTDFHFESKLNAQTSTASLLSTTLCVETLDAFYVSRVSEFAWEVTYKFRNKEISATELYQNEPTLLPCIGDSFLLEMLEADKADIRALLQ